MRFPIVPLAFLLACGGPAEEEEEDPAEHACEHVAESGDTVTAGTSMEEASAVVLSEEPVAIALPEGEAGFVQVEVDEETAALLFVDTANVVAGLWHDGEEETLPTPSPNEFCGDDLPEHFELDLHPGTWTFELGPAAVDAIWWMLMSAEGHVEH